MSLSSDSTDSAEKKVTIETATAEKKKKVTLKTGDNVLFEVDVAVAMEFFTVKSFLEDDPSNDTVIPLPNVDAKALMLVIDFCKNEVEFREKSSLESEKKKFAEKFLKNMGIEQMVEMILACNYLNIEYLLNLLTSAMADKIKNKSVAYVRKFFGVENDFTPEEEAAIRAENEWAFEGVDKMRIEIDFSFFIN